MPLLPGGGGADQKRTSGSEKGVYSAGRQANDGTIDEPPDLDEIPVFDQDVIEVDESPDFEQIEIDIEDEQPEFPWTQQQFRLLHRKLEAEKQRSQREADTRTDGPAQNRDGEVRPVWALLE